MAFLLAYSALFIFLQAPACGFTATKSIFIKNNLLRL